MAAHTAGFFGSGQWLRVELNTWLAGWKRRYLHCVLQFFNAGQLKHIYKKSFKNIVFFYSVFTMFSVENTVIYHVFRYKVGPKHWFLQCFQGSGIKKTFNSLISPNPWTHRYLHCFLQFFHVPMPLANSNIYTKNPSKTVFSMLWHPKTIQNIAISVFFHLRPFFHCRRKPTKMTQNYISIPY